MTRRCAAAARNRPPGPSCGPAAAEDGEEPGRIRFLPTNRCLNRSGWPRALARTPGTGLPAASRGPGYPRGEEQQNGGLSRRRVDAPVNSGSGNASSKTVVPTQAGDRHSRGLGGCLDRPASGRGRGDVQRTPREGAPPLQRCTLPRLLTHCRNMGRSPSCPRQGGALRRLKVNRENVPAHRGEAGKEHRGRPARVSVRQIRRAYSPHSNAGGAFRGWPGEEAKGNPCPGSQANGQMGPSTASTA